MDQIALGFRWNPEDGSTGGAEGYDLRSHITLIAPTGAGKGVPPKGARPNTASAGSGASGQAEPGRPAGSRAAWRTAWMMISTSVAS
jgi:hypothetical protein